MVFAAVKFGAADGQTLEPVEGHVQGQFECVWPEHRGLFLLHNVCHFTLKDQVAGGNLRRVSQTMFVTHVRVFPGSMSTASAAVFCRCQSGSLRDGMATHPGHGKHTSHFSSLRAKCGNPDAAEPALCAADNTHRLDRHVASSSR